jgi:hypothetical protein
VKPIRNKNGLWWQCLLKDRDEMSILSRGPSIDASYQVSVHLGKWFQRRRLLEINQPETGTAYIATRFVSGSERTKQS